MIGILFPLTNVSCIRTVVQYGLNNGELTYHAVELQYDKCSTPLLMSLHFLFTSGGKYTYKIDKNVI